MKKLVSVSTLIVLIATAPALAAPRPKDLATIAGLGVIAGLWIHAAKSKRAMLTRSGEASVPEWGAVSQAKAGESVYANYNYEAVKVAIPAKEIMWDLGQQLWLGPDTPLYQMTNGKFCLESGNPCWEDKDDDGDFDKVGRDPDSGKKSDLPYELTEVQFEPELSGFRSELVFQGVAAGVLHLAYREFIDDMARPAFTQQLRFDYQGDPMTIAFQALEFEIQEAGNMGVVYTVHEASN